MRGRESIRVVARDGELVGMLEHVAMHPDTGRAAGLVVERDRSAVLVPLSAVRKATGRLVTLSGTAGEYADLPRFDRAAYRLLDRELEREETREWMASMGIEDYEIGGEDAESFNEKTPDAIEQHTGAENPYRRKVQNGHHPRPIEDDAADQDDTTSDEARRQTSERTRSDMH